MSPQNDPDVLALSEETLSIHKRTQTETIETLAVADLQHEAIEVTRVAVNRRVNAAPPIRTEGDLTIFPVIEEVLVVEKRLVVTEEIYVRRLIEDERDAAARVRDDVRP